MPTAEINGVDLYYEVTGTGFPLVWSHEFAGDYRSWDAQVKFFSRRYQVITYNYRGFPPSAVPTDPNAYSQEHLLDDLYGLLRHLGIAQAHVGGLSMGGSITLQFGIAHPEMCRSLIVAGAGAGTTHREEFLREVADTARRFQAEGMPVMAEEYARGRTRLQFLRKDPKGWEEFKKGLAQHSSLGSALTFRGVQRKRPTIYALGPPMLKLRVPTLLLCGDEDEPCIEPAVFMKRHIPSSGLVFLPQSGHTINLEEPDLFNRTVMDFLATVEAGRWAERDVEKDVGFALR